MRDEIDLPPPLRLKVFSNAGGICANAASASTALGSNRLRSAPPRARKLLGTSLPCTFSAALNFIPWRLPRIKLLIQHRRVRRIGGPSRARARLNGRW